MNQQETPLSLNFYPHQELGHYECGRDLFTFITVASSHIMRTLQRPKKSHPTKRKVNHQRFLQNQICRKYAVIEAATKQLASSILSQEAEIEKQLPQLKINASMGIMNNTPKTLINKQSSLAQMITDHSTNLQEIPEVDFANSTFVGVAEAYLVPDKTFDKCVSMDTLSCISDEVGTVESLFDDIMTEENIVFPTCRLYHPSACSVAKIQSEEEAEIESNLKSGLGVYESNMRYYVPTNNNRMVWPVHNISKHINQPKGDSTEGFLFSNPLSSSHNHINLPSQSNSREIITAVTRKPFAFKSPSPEELVEENDIGKQSLGISCPYNSLTDLIIDSTFDTELEEIYQKEGFCLNMFPGYETEIV